MKKKKDHQNERCRTIGLSESKCAGMQVRQENVCKSRQMQVCDWGMAGALGWSIFNTFVFLWLAPASQGHFQWLEQNQKGLLVYNSV